MFSMDMPLKRYYKTEPSNFVAVFFCIFSTCTFNDEGMTLCYCRPTVSVCVLSSFKIYAFTSGLTLSLLKLMFTSGPTTFQEQFSSTLASSAYLSTCVCCLLCLLQSVFFHNDIRRVKLIFFCVCPTTLSAFGLKTVSSTGFFPLLQWRIVAT